MSDPLSIDLAFSTSSPSLNASASFSASLSASQSASHNLSASKDDDKTPAKPKFIGSFLSPQSRSNIFCPSPEETPIPSPRAYKILFAGSNEEHEIESLDEFFAKAKSQDIPLKGWNFQAVDFSTMDVPTWNSYLWEGAIFLGCTFPTGISPVKLREQGCQVWENPANVPFITFRSQMYTQEDLAIWDKIINDHYRNNERDFSVRMAESMHDFSMRDALFDYLEGKTPVGIMGSHSLKRGSEHYKQLVRLTRKLAQAGFLVVTGGGAGAMEAANLGAYLSDKCEPVLEQALKIIETGNEGDLEFLNPIPAINVVEKFGIAEHHLPSLGIPTFRYSKEPYNRFAAYHAKFFSNALREDGLIHICRGGIIFGQGGPGTRQEVFQSACVNHEQFNVDDQCPMIFLDSAFWKENGVYDVVYNTSKGAPFHDDLLLTDNIDQIVAHLVGHAKRKRLPLIKHWKKLDKYRITK